MGSLPQVLNQPGYEEPKSGNAVLEAVHLNVFFKRFGSARKNEPFIKAVDDVSFRVLESEFISVVGESGSGKTTLARCIMGLTPPTSGSVNCFGLILDGREHIRFRDHWKNVQIVYQDPYESLNPRHDVFRIVSLPIRRLEGVKDSTLRHRVEDLLTEVGLDPSFYMHRLPHQLSGGERQRISIARALAPNPKLLIADEPITMLDATQRRGILTLLAHLKSKRNLTVVMITHDLLSASAVSDRVLVMYLGRIVESGPKNAVMSRPHHPYTRLVLDSSPRLNKSRNSSEAQVGTLGKRAANGCAFAPRCAYSTQICMQQVPQLLEKTPSHLASCHNPLNLENDTKN
jgi:oligopeptide/dipeptide ABC transporter ATP-binding protein